MRRTKTSDNHTFNLILYKFIDQLLLCLMRYQPYFLSRIILLQRFLTRGYTCDNKKRGHYRHKLSPSMTTSYSTTLRSTRIHLNQRIKNLSHPIVFLGKSFACKRERNIPPRSILTPFLTTNITIKSKHKRGLTQYKAKQQLFATKKTSNLPCNT